MPNPVAGLVGGSIGSAIIGSRSSSKAAKTQANAAEDAAAAQLQAARETNDLNRYIYDNTVDLTEPQRRVGNNALAILGAEMGVGRAPSIGDEGHQIFRRRGPGGAHQIVNDEGAVIKRFARPQMAEQYMRSRQATFEESPGYDFVKSEGYKGLERQQAARGVRLGGASMKEAIRFNQGLASQEYGNYMNRLASLGGVGQTATQTQVGAGQNYAANAGNALMNAGNARASAYQNAGAAQAQGIMGQNAAIQGGINNAFQIVGMQRAGMFS